jgi:hypothetical protein
MRLVATLFLAWPLLPYPRLAHTPRLATDLPTIPPLPFRRGEGRGEGSDLSFRDATRVIMSSSYFSKGESQDEAEQSARSFGPLDSFKSVCSSPSRRSNTSQ